MATPVAAQLEPPMNRAPSNAPTTPRAIARLWKVLGSLQIAVACLALLMVLVVLCTLAQVRLGTFGAVDAYIRTLFVWWSPPGASWRVPVMPGGGLVGLVLMVNLIVAQFGRLERSWRKAGLWFIHFGLILLFAGEFVTGLFQVETQMALEEGETGNFAEAPREAELAVIDTAAPDYDEVFAVPQARLTAGQIIAHPGLPFTLLVKRAYRNSTLVDRGPQAGGEPVLATQGVGPGIVVRPDPPVTRDDFTDRPSAWVEVRDGQRSLGTWLVSLGITREQGFELNGRRYQLSIRPKRRYMPFSLTLLDFRHEKHPGTEVPRHFSSRVLLSDEGRGERREVLISMNEPLRYGRKAFYQASFGKEDTLSILQVVDNPGWIIPYAACVLVAAGLLWHFLYRLRLSRGTA